MPSVSRCRLPDDALLAIYRRDGYYTDCYTTVVAGKVTHPEYVKAFYTTALFRVERIILKWIASKPSSDRDVDLLAESKADTFAAWRVEARQDDQLLLSDFRGQTRSWLMVRSCDTAEGPATRLYFGSAVVRIRTSRPGKREGSLFMRLILRFHWLYSRALLASASARLAR